MMKLIPEINAHFNSLKESLDCMQNLGFQSEGWFKVELLTLLRRLEQEQRLTNLDREIALSSPSIQIEGVRKRIDIGMHIEGQRHWVELKQWLIGVQGNYTYTPAFYLSDPSSTGIIQDLEKLIVTSPSDYRWLMILLTKNPGINAWNVGLEKFSQKFPLYHLSSLTSPTDYPEHYFLGVLQIGADVSK